MDPTYEAVAYPQDTVLLLRKTFLREPRRAMVTVFDEPPRFTESTGPLADEPMREPLVLADRVIDLAEVSEIYDRGDYVLVNFSLFHQPPHLYLRGKYADALRAWAQREDQDPLPTDVLPQISEQELAALKEQVMLGEPLSTDRALKLLNAVAATKSDRDAVIRDDARSVQLLMDGCHELLHELTEKKVRSVQCLLGEGCKVLSDNSCIHTHGEKLW